MHVRSYLPGMYVRLGTYLSSCVCVLYIVESSCMRMALLLCGLDLSRHQTKLRQVLRYKYLKIMCERSGV